MYFRNEYSFLSNFYKSPLQYKGFTFPTAEHAYQASKCIYSEDFDRIRMCESPSIAKRMGKRIPVRDDWNSVKLKVMYEILDRKFSDSELEQRLLNIDGVIVEENNWNDTFLGCL